MKASGTQNHSAYMKLPPEIRIMIYELLLTVPDMLPIQRPYNVITTRYRNFRTAILGVSRMIHAEAAPILYGRNTFSTENHSNVTTAYDLEHVNPPLKRWITHHHSSSCAHECCTPSPETQARLIEDVSKVRTRYKKNVPQWLFGKAWLRNSKTCHKVYNSPVPGYSFAWFLRQIGPQNAGTIRSLRIYCRGQWLHHMRQIYHELPLYAAMIKQFLHNVRDVILEIGPQKCYNPESNFYRGEEPCLVAEVLHHVRDLILHSAAVRSVSVESHCKCLDGVWVSHIKQSIQGYLAEKIAQQAARLE